MKNPLLQKSNPSRVLRGGSWVSGAWYTRVSNRYRGRASRRLDFQGFRLFRTKERS